MIDATIMYQSTRGILMGTDGSQVSLYDLAIQGYSIDMCVGNSKSKIKFVPGVYEPFGNVRAIEVTPTNCILMVDDIYRPWFDGNLYWNANKLHEVLVSLNREIKTDDCYWLCTNVFPQELFVNDGPQPIPLNIFKLRLVDCIRGYLINLISTIQAGGRLGDIDQRFMQCLYGYQSCVILNSICATGFGHVVNIAEVNGFVVPTICTIPVMEIVKETGGNPNSAATWYGVNKFEKVPTNQYLTSGC